MRQHRAWGVALFATATHNNLSTGVNLPTVANLNNGAANSNTSRTNTGRTGTNSNTNNQTPTSYKKGLNTRSSNELKDIIDNSTKVESVAIDFEQVSKQNAAGFKEIADAAVDGADHLLLALEALSGCDLIAIAQNHSTEFLEIEHAFQRIMTDSTSPMPERFG